MFGKERRKAAFLFVLCLMFLWGCGNWADRVEDADDITEVIEADTAQVENNQIGDLEMAENQTDTQIIYIDTSKPYGTPLLKKFGLYNSGLLRKPVYERDGALMRDIRADSLRIDLYMGEPGHMFSDIVTGTYKDLQYDFTELDWMANYLHNNGVKPYWSWSYIPTPLQYDGNWRSGPRSLEAWGEMFSQFARHYREEGIRIAYNEIYNEPDCNGVFFSGTWDDYVEMYIHAANGLKAGDSDAVVGGPSTAFPEQTGRANLLHFLDRVDAENAPLDFFSYHSYGYDQKQYLMRTRVVRAALSERPEFDTTELHFNEYNAVLQPFTPHNETEHTMGAVQMLNSFEELLDETDVTLAHWAQYMDNIFEQLGMIGTNGKTKVGYFAFWAYSRMPVDRVAVENLPKGVRAMAGADEERTGLLLWNETKMEKDISLTINVNRQENKTYRVYRMDDASDPYWNGGDTTIRPVEEGVFEGDSYTYEGTLKGPGLLYIALGDNDLPELAQPDYTVVRKHYYFPERGKLNYSFYDELNDTFYLGMNGETSARSTVGITIDDVPDKLFVTTKASGSYKAMDNNSCYMVRVDYIVDGKAAKSAAYTYLTPNARREALTPWGTMEQPDVMHNASSLMNGSETLDIRADAPDGWDGRIILSIDMHSAGSDARVKVNFTAVQ